MRSLFAIVLVLVSVFTMNVSASAATFHGTWSKPIYTCDGLMTLSTEVVKYDLDVPEGTDIGTVIETMPAVIGTTVLQGQFSNLRQLETLINRALQHTGYRNFRIVDVYVDER